MRNKRWALYLALLAAFLFPAAAQAASPYDGPKSISIQVVNSNGVPQPAARAWVELGGNTWLVRMDEQARISPRPYTVGARIYATRANDSGNPEADAATAPEGLGQSYRVLSSSPTSVQIVLPALERTNYTPFQPEISDDERGFVGLLNDERERRCLQPAQISSTLSAVADRYANLLSKEYDQPLAGESHYYYWDPHLRSADAGYPSGLRGEVVARGSVRPRDTFEALSGSAPHSAVMFDSTSGCSSSSPPAAGVALAKGPQDPFWVVLIGECDWVDEFHNWYEVCGPTGDYGDSSLAEEEVWVDPEKPSEEKLSISKFGRANKRHLKLNIYCRNACTVKIRGNARYRGKRARTARTVVRLQASQSRIVRIRYTHKLRKMVLGQGRPRLRLVASSNLGQRQLRIALP